MRHLIVNVPTTEMRLYPINDVQVGAHGVDEKRFGEYIKRLAKDPIGRGLGIGDYTDGISPSNRAAIKAADAQGNWYEVGHDMLRDASLGQADRFLELVKPARGRIDALLKGHHFHAYTEPLPDGSTRMTSSDIYIAEKLGVPYLDDPSSKKQMALITYKMPQGRAVQVLVMHGEGSGEGMAAPLNRLMKMVSSIYADIYLTAHHHKIFGTKIAILRPDAEARTKLNHDDVALAACGSWMRGYIENEATYAEAGIMAPLAIGAPTIYAKALKDRVHLEVTV